MSRILVTGGAGFVGSNLCEHLLAQGHDVICLDNFYTGREENIAHLKSDPRFSRTFTVITHDVIEPFDGLDLGVVDQVYHLACPASPPHYQRDKIFTMKTNVLGALNVLEFAKRHHARILFSSTSEVYGDPLEHPQREEYRGNVNPHGIRSCYDEGKRAAEAIFFDYHRDHGVDIRVIRIFNTYGPRMDPDDGRVVSNLIMQALRDEPLTIYGDGSQTRSFQYIADLIDGMERMMAQDGFVGPVNIGNPNEFTVRELAQKILVHTNRKLPIVGLPLPADDPVKRRPDISLAKRRLDWEPRVMLDEGLRKTIPYFASQLHTKG